MSIISSFLVGLTIGLTYEEAILKQLATLPIIVAVAGAATGAITLIISIIKSVADLQRKPRLKYLKNRIEVRSREDHTNERRFLYIYCFIAVQNSAHGIKAKDCEGFITLLNTDNVKHKMLWESNEYSTNIGYEELLRLFEITEIWDGQELERRTITFSPGLGEQLENNEDINGRKISVRIQSENAECPDKPFEIEIREVIKSAQAS